MKYIALTTAATAILAATSHADITYSMPGLETYGEVTGNEILNHKVDIGDYWGYKITGYEWKLVASDPVEGSGGYHNNGRFEDSDGNIKSLSSSLSVKIGGEEIISGSLLAVSTIDNQNKAIVETKSYTYPKPVTFLEKDIEFLISQSSEMQNDSGSYVTIYGEAIKNAPIPTGDFSPFELTTTSSESFFQADRGTVPILNYRVVKDTPVTTQPPIDVTWTPPIPAKDNSGIGNNFNEAGEKIMYDPDNKGQAKKYGEGGLAIPIDGELDIEGKVKK